MARRFLKFNFDGGSFKEIELKKVTSLKIPAAESKVCLHIDRIDDGYLLVVNEEFWDIEKKKLVNIEVVREN